MATSRIKTSSILQGFPKSRSLLAGNAAYDPAATFLIQRTTLSSTGTVTFTSIPQTYKHLQIRFLARHSASGNINGLVRLNGSSTSLITHYLTLLKLHIQD